VVPGTASWGIEGPVWPRLFGGCHVGRDTAGAIVDAGFTVTELERLTWPEGARGPEASVIVGCAVAA
jgi:hypothetical protein